MVYQGITVPGEVLSLALLRCERDFSSKILLTKCLSKMSDLVKSR